MQRIKKIVLTGFITLYLFFLLGFFFHTSRYPTIFGKYSITYFLGIVLGLFLFWPIVFFLLKTLCKKTIRFRTKKKVLSPIQHFLLVLLILILVMLIPAEIFLRIKYHGFEQNSYRYTIKSFHPFLQSQLTKEDQIHVNSFGFRGEEIKIRKPKNVFRIVILGGSTVLNREVSYEKNAARLLEKMLGQRYENKKIEVINAGKDGYTSEHSLIQYLFMIKDFDPDLIIMWHGINDMYVSCTPTDTQFGSFLPDYGHSLGAAARVAFSYFQSRPIVAVKLVSMDFFVRFLQENLYSDIIKDLQETRQNEEAKKYLYSKVNFLISHDYPSIKTYKRNLESLIRILDADGVNLILGNQPNLYKKSMNLKEARYAIYPRLVCQKDGKYYSLDSIRYGINLFNSTTKQVAKENNIPFLDLEAAIPKSTKYFVDMVHYSEEGNLALAKSLFAKIVIDEYIR